MSRAEELLILTCEHGGNRIPGRYGRAFAGARRLLETHRGYDPGSLWLARRLARGLGAPLHAATTSRLLIELNRSPEHPEIFSSFARQLGEDERGEILRRYYHPHRERVERAIREGLRRVDRVLHVAVHTFTPRRRGVPRRADVGLLYDPRRPRELELCRRWQAGLRSLEPRLRVWRNYPYRGWTDGLATTLRARFAPESYLGVELEVSQAHLRPPGPRSRRIASLLETSLGMLLEAPA